MAGTLLISAGLVHSKLQAGHHVLASACGALSRLMLPSRPEHQALRRHADEAAALDEVRADLDTATQAVLAQLPSDNLKPRFLGLISLLQCHAQLTGSSAESSADRQALDGLLKQCAAELEPALGAETLQHLMAVLQSLCDREATLLGPSGELSAALRQLADPQQPPHQWLRNEFAGAAGGMAGLEAQLEAERQAALQHKTAAERVAELEAQLQTQHLAGLRQVEALAEEAKQREAVIQKQQAQLGHARQDAEACR